MYSAIRTAELMQAAIQAWLEKQCGHADGVTGAVVLVLPRNSKSLVPAAHWPPGGLPCEGLAVAAKAAYERQQPLSQPRLNGAERPVPLGPMFSCPIQLKGRTVGAVAVGFDPEAAVPPQAIVDSLTRAAEGFENFVRQGAVPVKPAASEARTPITTNYVPSDDRTQPLGATLGSAPNVSPAHPTAPAAATVPPAATVGPTPAEIPTLRSEVGE